MRVFNDIKIGDKIIVCDKNSDDYNEHIIKVTVIEHSEEHKTKTNPKGMLAYGEDLSRIDNIHPINQVSEDNFICFAEDKNRLEI